MTKIIALDAGHGLKTAGKQTPDGIKEWTLNDKVRDYVVEYLKDYDCKVIFTDNNEGNVDEGLSTRRTTYINAKADVFVSIHHNAYTSKWNTATGVEVFTDKNATDADVRLANAIYKNLPAYTGLRGRGIKKENWTVINQNNIPAVLVEGGFMDSTIDHPVITSAAGQQGYAKAVFEGLVEFLDLKKKEVPVEAYSGYVQITYSGSDGIDIHSKPVFSGSVVKVAKKGEVFQIVGRIKVSGTYMYKLTDGNYITSATKYVKYTKTKPVTKTMEVNSKVKLKTTATVYQGASKGKKIPWYIKGRKYTVKQINGNIVLLKEINSWVLKSECELV